MHIRIVDNNDSFTRNLEHLLAEETGQRPEIVPYGAFDPGDRAPELLVISPGPGHPRDYPKYTALFAEDGGAAGLPDGPPVLGVCLGMQLINEAFGGETRRLPGCVHGRAEEVDFEDARLTVARYHSLHVAVPGDHIEVFCRNDRGVAMALRHTERKLLGYQFHPESFLTAAGGYFIRYALADLL